MLQKLIVIILVSAFISGCYDDFDNTVSEEIPAPPSTIINTMLSGGVNTTDGAVIRDYIVDWTSGSKVVEGKHFITDLKQVDKLNQTMWIRKDDVVIGLGQWPLVENDINYVSFLTFDDKKNISLTGGSIISDRLTIGKVLESGSMSMRIIDDASNLLGHGWTAVGELQSLNDVQIIELTFSGSPSVEFDVKEGNELYKYDDARGRWISALSQVNGIDGTEYYAVAKGNLGVVTSGKTLYESEDVSYQNYLINNERQGRSTVKGNWIEVLANHTEHNVKLVNPCQDIINAIQVITEVSPLVKDLKISSDAIVQEIKTQVLDCDGEHVEEMAIQVTAESGEQALYFFSDSEINTLVPICNKEFSIAAYNPATEETGLDFPWMVSIEDQFSYLSTCPDFAEGYSLYEIGDELKIYNRFIYRVEGNKIILSSSDDSMKLIINGASVGDYEVDMINVKIYDPNFGTRGYAVNCENSNFGCGIDMCYVSHLKETNNWVRVSFSGNIWMQTIQPAKAGTYQVEGIIICKAE